jgi:hypothetical protein
MNSRVPKIMLRNAMSRNMMGFLIKNENVPIKLWMPEE